MKKENFSWASISGEILFANVWEPESDVKAVFCLIHGFGEHCMRYEPYVKNFVDAGFAVLAYDLIGHGASEGKRGAISSYDQLLGDVQTCVDKAELFFKDTPVFIYGHSMGGNISLNYLLKKQPSIKGAIITSPWLKLANDQGKFVKTAVSFAKNIFPNLTVNSGLKDEFISTVKEEVDKYKTDEKNHGRISFRLFDAVTKNGVWAMQNAKSLKVKTLLMHGDADQITSHQASATMAKTNVDFIDYKEWPNCYHELHNDTVRAELASKVIDWVNKQLS